MSGRRCGWCRAKATLLCDEPLALAPGVKLSLEDDIPTCDAPLCADCVVQVGITFACGIGGHVDSVDRCPVHAPGAPGRLRPSRPSGLRVVAGDGGAGVQGDLFGGAS